MFYFKITREDGKNSHSYIPLTSLLHYKVSTTFNFSAKEFLFTCFQDWKIKKKKNRQPNAAKTETVVNNRDAEQEDWGQDREPNQDRERSRIRGNGPPRMRGGRNSLDTKRCKYKLNSMYDKQYLGTKQCFQSFVFRFWKNVLNSVNTLLFSKIIIYPI